MRIEWIAAAVIVVILVFVFNRLVRQRNSVREGWSGIDVQLRVAARRAAAAVVAGDQDGNVPNSREGRVAN